MKYNDKWIYTVRILLIKRFITLNQTLRISRAWIFLLLFIVLIFETSSALAAEASEETIAKFKAAIEAFKNVKHPATGKGSALVETYVRNIPSMTRKVVVDFIFKSDLSRSIRSSIKEDKQKQPEVLWVVGKKCAITYNYNRRHASVQRHPPLQFHHRLGYDFNPNTFMLSYSTPLAVHFERVLKGPATLSAKMDNKGILNLISEYKDPNTYQHHVIYVDPNMGYRLVGSLAIMERIDRPSRNHTDFLEVKWEKYKTSWYIRSAKFASYTGIHSPQDRSSLDPDDLRRSTIVTVQDFHPNVKISDSEFTLNGLGLPGGTRVIDRISGVNYRLDVGQMSRDLLKEPLLDAEFPK